MRRSRGSISWRGPDKALITVNAGYDPVTGKRVRLSRVVRGSKREVERELEKLQASTGKVQPSAGRVTLHAYMVDTWLPTLAEQQRRTVEGYESIIEHHIQDTIGRFRLDEITPYMIELWLAKLKTTGMSGTTRRNVFRVLSGALARAAEWGHLPSSPAVNIKCPRPDDHDPVVLTVEEANRLLDSFSGSELMAGVTIALATGLRRSEVCGLTWGDVDLKAGTIAVSKTMQESRGEVYAGPTKTRLSHRLVTLPAWAIRELTECRGVGRVVPCSPNQFTSRYRAIRDKAKLPAVPLRDLRHTHGTLAIEAGVDLVSVSRRLGHSNTAITDKHYLRPKRSADQVAADKIDALFDRSSRQKLPTSANESDSKRTADDERAGKSASA